jgi:hypothetical protein
VYRMNDGLVCRQNESERCWAQEAQQLPVQQDNVKAWQAQCRTPVQAYYGLLDKTRWLLVLSHTGSAAATAAGAATHAHNITANGGANFRFESTRAASNPTMTCTLAQLPALMVPHQHSQGSNKPQTNSSHHHRSATAIQTLQPTHSACMQDCYLPPQRTTVAIKSHPPQRPTSTQHACSLCHTQRQMLPRRYKHALHATHLQMRACVLLRRGSCWPTSSYC